MNPQFGLSCYNHHADGSGVALMTQARPMLDTRPRQFALMDPVEGGSGTARWVSENRTPFLFRSTKPSLSSASAAIQPLMRTMGMPGPGWAAPPAR